MIPARAAAVAWLRCFTEFGARTTARPAAGIVSVRKQRSAHAVRFAVPRQLLWLLHQIMGERAKILSVMLLAALVTIGAFLVPFH
jgi:hypothetical protein